MITCNEAVRRLWEYLDGTVDDADRAGIEAHLARCLRCCGQLDFAVELRGFLKRSTVRWVWPARPRRRSGRRTSGSGRPTVTV